MAGECSCEHGSAGTVPWVALALAMDEDGKGMGREGDERKLAVWRGPLPSAVELDALSTALRRRRRAAGMWPSNRNALGGYAPFASGSRSEIAGATSGTLGDRCDMAAVEAGAGSMQSQSDIDIDAGDAIAELFVNLSRMPEAVLDSV